MDKNPIIYIQHISDCIKKIIEYTYELDELSFLENTTASLSVCFSLCDLQH